MSALPQPDSNRHSEARRPARSPAATLLTNALAERANLRARGETRQAALAAAREGQADSVDFLWSQPEGADVDIRVYFEAGETIIVLAVETQRIDERQPSLAESLACEDEFLAELDAGGDTWERFASFVWEKSHFQTGIDRP